MGQSSGQEESSRRPWLVACIVVLVAAAVGCGALLMISGWSAAPRKLVCLTRECIESAYTLVNYMDDTVDPCQDFYKFSCGSFLKKMRATPSMPPSMLSEAALVAAKNVLEMPGTRSKSEAVVKMKTIYQSCLIDLTSDDEKVASRKMRTELERSGFSEWPAILAEWNDPNKRFLNVEWLLSIHSTYGMFPLFLHFSVHPHTVMIDARGRDRLGDVDKLGALMTEFFSHLQVPYPARTIKEIVAFERKLWEVANRTAELDDGGTDNHTVSQMNELYPQINWTLFFRHVAQRLDAEPSVVDLVRVEVSTPQYLTQVLQLVTETPARTFHSFMAWRFVLSCAPYLGRPFSVAKLILTIESSARAKTVPPLWNNCLSHIRDGFPQPLALEYAKVMFNQHMQDDITSQFESIKASFARNLPHHSWLTEQTIALIKAKLENFTAVIAYPPLLMNVQELDQRYQNTEIRDNNFLFNMLSVKKLSSHFKFTSSPLEFSKFRMYDPVLVNAFNLGSENTIIIPISILYPPFYQKDRPKYLNYGSIGSTLGHELGHSFDIGGIWEGFEEPGWSEAQVEEFGSRAACYSEQYAGLEFTHPGAKKNWYGNRSLRDDIADNVGLLHSYLAYLRHEAQHGEEPGLPGLQYTNRQLLLMQYAQQYCQTMSKDQAENYVDLSHSPGEIRVKGPIQNLPQFGEIFNCPLGSPMNPASKCELWT